VLDESEAVIPEAKVTVTNQDTAFQRSVTSGKDGPAYTGSTRTRNDARKSWICETPSSALLWSSLAMGGPGSPPHSGGKAGK
jgi:hypothetical protein